VRLFGRTARDERLLELLEMSGRNVGRVGQLLEEMLDEYPERAGLAREILLCEQEGDRIAHDVIHHLAEPGRPAPFETRDVYDLVSALDDIVDYAEQTADSLVLYGIEAPMEQAQQLAQVLAKAASVVQRALEQLHGDRDLNGSLVEIHELENDGDRISRDAIGSLFANGIDPMVVIRWKDIFESLEQAIDSCETVAHVLEGITLKRRD
jgi:predicted phosphate transport protein (TIGR00153 family)